MVLISGLKMPPKFVLASILISFGASIFGMDTGMIGPITTMPQFISTFGVNGISSTVHGAIVSSILIPAAIASFFAGHLANKVGRVRGVAIGELVFGIGAAIEAGSVKSLGMLIVGRCLAGVGEGLFLSTLTVYICEISPPRLRGSLASTPQMFISTGLMIGYFLCYGTVNITSTLSWRLPFTIQSILSIFFSVLTICFLEESPRWLNSVGRKEEALRVWERLAVNVAEREKDVGDVEVREVMESNGEDEETDGGISGHGPELRNTISRTSVVKVKVHAFLRVFQKDVRKRTTLGSFLMSMQQFGGIDGVLYYAPILFTQAGLSSTTSSFLASGISSILIFLTTIPALLFADKWPRRTSTLTGGLSSLICMFTIGALYASDSVHPTGAARWVVIIAIYVYAVLFSLTWGVIIKVYASEIQPAETRATASSLSQSSNWVSNFIIALTTPIFLAHSRYGAYIFFGSCNLLTVIVCLLFMPETRGKSLEEIDEAFRQHTFAGTFASGRAKLSDLLRRKRRGGE